MTMNPEELLGDILRERRITLSVAESCTGGRMADKITNIPGSSDYFLGCAVSYSNEAKMAILGVEDVSLRNFGAVSEQVAIEMVIGCLTAFDSDFAVGTTGIAGHSGGTPDKPVGLVWFAAADWKRTETEKVIFSGDREAIKESASVHALEFLIKFIEEK